MKLLVLLLLCFSLPALACWRAEGSFAVDGETWKLNQRIEHGKEYVFPFGTFILKFTLNKGKREHNMVYVVQEKKGLSLTDVTMGEEAIPKGKQKEIFAKGLPGQPNSIITIKLINI